jgi:ABC-2 type transport system permease protein
MTPQLFLQVAGLEARKRMGYRADFWITAVLGVVVEFGAAWFLWRAVFSVTGRTEVGGWTLPGMVAYYVAAILLGRLVRGPEFEGVVSNDIYEGSLSRYLVYPASYFGFKYAQAVGAAFPAALQVVVFGSLALLLFPMPADVRVTPLSLGMGLVAVGAASFLHFLLSFPIQSVAFWADNVWSLTVAQRLVAALLGGFMFPLSVFPEWAQYVLHLLPFRLFFAWPVEVVLGRADATAWVEGLASAAVWSAAIAGISWGVWRRGRLRYTGVGM